MKTSPKVFIGCKKNDRQAQEQLYRDFYPDLMRISLRYLNNKDDAQDLVNRAMLKVFITLDSFRGDVNTLGGWTRRIFINECLDFIRKQKAFSQYCELSETLQEYGQNSFRWEEDDPEELLALLKALPVLPRTVFNLFVIEGYGHKEIAEMLAISVANSKWNLHIAKKEMRQMISEKQML